MSVLFFTAIILPYRMALYDDDPDLGWLVTWLIINGLFFTDLILTFCTIYTDSTNNEVTSHKKIAIRYLKGWFIIDLLSCLPFDLMVPGQANFNILTRIMRTSRMYKLLRLLRLLKVLNIAKK